MNIATKTKRFLAYLLDGVILVLVFSIILTVYTLVIGGSAVTLANDTDNTGLGLVATLSSVVTLVVSVLFIVWYYVLYPSASNGATLGKKVLKTRVTNKDGSAVSKGKHFLRFLVLNLGPINWITIFFMEENQTLADMILGTRVVDAQ